MRTQQIVAIPTDRDPVGSVVADHNFGMVMLPYLADMLAALILHYGHQTEHH